MKVKMFSDRLPTEVIKHLDEAGEIEIINIFAHNNRYVAFYKDKPVKKKEKKLEIKDLNNG